MLQKIKRRILIEKELFSISDLSKSNQKSIIENNKSIFDQIRQKHQSYVRDISSPEMAMSLELAYFIMEYCLKNKPKYLLDLGSGFSSYIFRLYQKNDTTGNVVVFSVDDNDDWLEKTKTFLIDEELSTDNLINLNTLINTNHNNYFDFILLDLNFIEVRKDYIKYTADLLKMNGVAIIDDVHKVEFLREVKKISNQNNLKLTNIRKKTIDCFGRFAIALNK